MSKIEIFGWILLVLSGIAIEHAYRCRRKNRKTGRAPARYSKTNPQIVRKV